MTVLFVNNHVYPVGPPSTLEALFAAVAQSSPQLLGLRNGELRGIATAEAIVELDRVADEIRPKVPPTEDGRDLVDLLRRALAYAADVGEPLSVLRL